MIGTGFAWLYDTLMIPLECAGLRNIRRQLIRDAHGMVLEVGSGTGLNFPYYQDAAQVVAIEPDPVMIEPSLSRAKNTFVPIAIVQADAERLPFPDRRFDMAVATLVFCTLPNPVLALSELRRVCKSDARVLFFEHVRARHPLLGALQDALTPLWKRLAGGCHLNRDTLARIESAGFEIRRLERHCQDIFLVIETVNRQGSSH